MSMVSIQSFFGGFSGNNDLILGSSESQFDSYNGVGLFFFLALDSNETVVTWVVVFAYELVFYPLVFKSVFFYESRLWKIVIIVTVNISPKYSLAIIQCMLKN